MADSTFEPEVKRGLSWLQGMRGGNMPSFAIECKKTQSATLSFSEVKDHQIEGLLDFEKQGFVHKMVVSQGFGSQQRFMTKTPFDFVVAGVGRGWVLVNFRFTKAAPRKDIKKGTNRCFAVGIHEYIAAKDEAIAAGRASLSYDWFVENAIECQRLRIKKENGTTESAWDLQKLLA